MKQTNFSSSGELSESQGLNDFLNAHNLREESQALNKSRAPTFLPSSSMNPRHNDLVGYPSQNSKFMMDPKQAQYFPYDEEEFDEYGEEEGYMEYEEEKDPYDYEVDLGPPKKRNAAKTLDKSYEERKKALQKKRDTKKKAKEEEEKRKEEQEKRRKIELAMQQEKTKEKHKERKSMEDIKEIQIKKPNEKISFDIADAINVSESSHSKSGSSSKSPEEDYPEPKPEVYDTGEMLKYLGKSSIPSKNQDNVIKTEEDESEQMRTSEKNTSKRESDVYDVSQTNQYLKKIELEESRKPIEDFKQKESPIIREAPLIKDGPSLPISTPNEGFEGLIKASSQFKDVIDQKENEVDLEPHHNEEVLEKTTLLTINPSKKLESFHSFAPEASFKPIEEPPFKNSSLKESIPKANEQAKLNRDLLHKNLDLEEANKRNEAYQTELESLVEQLEIAERKVKELEQENKTLRYSSESKLRFQQEKTSFLDKMNETRIINTLNEQFLSEKESFLLEIERLKAELAYSQEQNANRLAQTRELKLTMNKKQEIEEEVQSLRRQLLDYKELIKDPIVQRRARKKEEIGDLEEDGEDFRREFEFQELLIKGYQKENERNMYEIRGLKEELEQMTTKVFERDQGLTSLKARLAKETKGYLLMEEELRIPYIKGVINPDVIVSGNEVKELRGRVVALQGELRDLKEERVKLIKEIEEVKMEGFTLKKEIKGLKNEKDDWEKEKIEFLKEIDKIKRRNEEEIKELIDKNKELIDKEKERILENENKVKNDEKINITEKYEEISKELSKKNSLLETQIKELNKREKALLLKISSIDTKIDPKLLKKPIKAKIDPKSLKNPIKNVKKLKEMSPEAKISPLKENKPINLLNESISLSGDLIPMAKVLKFMESPSIFSFIKLYSIIKDLSNEFYTTKDNFTKENTKENIKENLKEFTKDSQRDFIQDCPNDKYTKELLKDLKNKIKGLPSEFLPFEEELEGIGSFADRIDLLSLKKSFENSLLNWILNGKNETKIFSFPLKNNFLQGESSDRWKQVELENKSLKDLINSMPKNPTRVDFEILERKLEFIERNYRQKELEITMALEFMKNPLKLNNTNNEIQALKVEMLSMRNQFEREKKELEDGLKRKNTEVESFREDINELLKELVMLKG